MVSADLGYLLISSDSFERTDELVEATSSTMINGEGKYLSKYRTLMRSSSPHEKKAFLYSLLRILPKRHLSLGGNLNLNVSREFNKKTLGGVAALIVGLIQDLPVLGDAIIDWLTGVSADGVGQSNDLHRAVIAALSSDGGIVFTTQPQPPILNRDRTNEKSITEEFGAVRG